MAALIFSISSSVFRFDRDNPNLISDLPKKSINNILDKTENVRFRMIILKRLIAVFLQITNKI